MKLLQVLLSGLREVREFYQSKTFIAAYCSGRKSNIMEEELNNPSQEQINKSEEAELSDLKEKVNVDQAAIEEARSAVGNDVDKIREYLINNRGL